MVCVFASLHSILRVAHRRRNRLGRPLGKVAFGSAFRVGVAADCHSCFPAFFSFALEFLIIIIIIFAELDHETHPRPPANGCEMGVELVSPR